MCGTAAGLVVALVGRLLVRWLRARNVGLAHWLDLELRARHAGAVDTAHALGVFHAFALGACFVLVSTVALALCAHSLVAFDALAVERASTSWPSRRSGGSGPGSPCASSWPADATRVSLFLAALVFWVAVRWLGR